MIFGYRVIFPSYYRLDPTCLRTKSESGKLLKAPSLGNEDGLYEDPEDDGAVLRYLGAGEGNGGDVSLRVSSKGGKTTGTGSGSGAHSRGHIQQTSSDSALLPAGGMPSYKTSDALLSRGSDPSATLSGLADKILGDPFLNSGGSLGGGRSHLKMLSGSRSGGGTVYGRGGYLDLVDDDEMFPVDDQELLAELMMEGDGQQPRAGQEDPDRFPFEGDGHQVGSGCCLPSGGGWEHHWRFAKGGAKQGRSHLVGFERLQATLYIGRYRCSLCPYSHQL